MTDAEYLFKLTERERKRNARGEKNKIKGGGGAVRLPSDNLTKKEREAMNGETVTYKVHSPVKWPEFKRWPPDIQREYFKRLDTSYRPTAAMYAEMFEIGVTAIGKLRAQLGIKTGNRGRSLPFYDGWQRFTNRGGGEEEKAAPETEKTEKPEASAPIMRMDKDGISFEPSFDPVVEMIRSLRGTGAKVTIEVTL